MPSDGSLYQSFACMYECKISFADRFPLALIVKERTWAEDQVQRNVCVNAKRERERERERKEEWENSVYQRTRYE